MGRLMQIQTVKTVVIQLIRFILLLFAASAVAFVLVSLSPIDPVQQYVLGKGNVSTLQREEIAEYWGLNEQPIKRYMNWLNSILHGEMGSSVYYRRPVVEILNEKFKNTFLLMITAWLLSGIAGFLVGCLMGVYKGKPQDSILKRICLFVCSIPAFWLGLIFLLLFSVTLGWFPIGFSSPIGMVNSDVTIWQKLHHLALPALTLSFLSFANVALHTRQKLVDVLESDYVLFAKARGKSTWQIMKQHGFRNILLPAVTLQFASFAELFGGSVLVENIFSYQGMGQAIVEAGLNSDVPLLLGITLVSTMFVFTGNTIANIIYKVVDPRIREERSNET